MKVVNKKLSKWLSLLLMVCVLSTMVPITASAASLSRYEVSIYAGRSFTLTSSTPVKYWKSSNTAIATVNSKGVVTGKGLGTCYIFGVFPNGSKLYCVTTVRSTSASRYITNAQMAVALNMIGAVESGNQVYGKRDYKSFAGPGTNTPGETSSTAGAYQEYGDNLRQLLLRIRKEYPRYFKKYDTAGIAKDLTYAWTSSRPYRVYRGTAKAKAIVNIISAGSGARLIQDIRCRELVDTYLAHARRLGVRNVRAALFLAECEHLGGASSVERVVRRAKDKNDMRELWRSLILDQKDNSSNYQIGDKIFQTRHVACYKWLAYNISANARMR
ncbi:MAG: hypothetical protein Q4B47_04000 [Eubacteriales bacterium]|nr:hypothetical protein [Eubacteriales bacterium]